MPTTMDKVERARAAAELAEQRARAAQFNLQTKALRLASSTYPTATRNRLRAGPTARGGSADSHRTWRDLDDMRRQAQELMRGNTLARGLVQRHIDMVVADGFSVVAETEDEAWNAESERQFNEWADSLDGFIPGGGGADVRGLMTLDEIACDLVRAGDVDGDRLILLLASGELQQVEAERVMNPNRGRNRPGLVNGVETDAVGRPVQFHVAEWDERSDGSAAKGATTPRPADRAIWWVNPLQNVAGATRGEPQLAASVGRYEDLEKYELAVRAAARMAACLGVIFKTANPAAMQGAFAGGTTVTPGEGPDTDEERVVDYKPGMNIHLRPGEEALPFTPSQPSQKAEEFIFTQVMMLSPEVGLPMFQALLDGRQVNLASMRALMQIVWRNFDRVQQALELRLYRRVYVWRTARAMRSGALPFNAGWLKHSWTRPSPPMMDPEVEIRAGKLAVDSRQSSLTRVMRRLHGLNFRRESLIIAEEQRVMRELGIEPVGQPGQKTIGGGGAATDGTDGGDGEEGAGNA